MSEAKQRTLDLTFGLTRQTLNTDSRVITPEMTAEALNTFRGPKGPKGDDGFIKFEELTDEQKELLRGPQGEQGPQGGQGIPGEQGPPGEPGKDAPQDAFTPSNPPTAEQVGALPSGGTAKDSEKLGGQMPSHYATAESVNQLSEQITALDRAKLGKTEQAADSAKLNGKSASEYALKTDLPTVDENEYRFLKTVELTSEQAGVISIEETFDTEYAGLIVTVSGGNTSTKDKTVYCKAGWPPNNAIGTGGNINDPAKAAQFVFRKLDGTWEAFGHIGYTWGESVMTGQVSAHSVFGYDSNNSNGYLRIIPSITFMSVYTSDSTGFPVGTKVTIFGKEA